MPANFANPAIKHVFVLMLENRSFDHMLGFINGNDISQYSNSYTYGNPPVTHVYHPVTPAHCSMKFDPGHEFPDVVKQLCGPDASYPAGGKYPIINNSGFVYNYATTHSSHEGGATGDFGEIMKCYDTNRQLPVMSSLVNNFMLCDNWFASIPGPTWPNRFFVHAASSNGFDTSPTMSEILEWETIHGFSFPNKSIYHRLKKYRKKYRLYRGVSSPLTGSIPGVAALKGIFLWETNKYENFENDLHGNYPFDYTFIEPNYGDIINNSYKGGQSQHPMDDVRGGEALIKSTYEAIRNSPLWKNSMLIITYDEHGGFYDHVAPLPAVSPGDDPLKSKYNKEYQFTFEQYGVRVPAIVISPYTPQGINNKLYDHSSVPATLETIFGMPPLTNRDANANNVTALADLASMRDTPDRLPDVATDCPDDAEAYQDELVPMDENKTGVDGGNLPVFLQVILKAELEKEPTKMPDAQQNIVAGFQSIQSRADARSYIENKLPGLLETNEGLSAI